MHVADLDLNEHWLKQQKPNNTTQKILTESFNSSTINITQLNALCLSYTVSQMLRYL